MSQLVQIMRSLRTMPPLPKVASRVLSIVQDPEYSIDTLVAVVRTDPALTARILKLCNASLFGLSQQITSVSDAVAYLGSRNLVKLVLVSCTANYFKDLPSNPYAEPSELWRQTLATATACQVVAERCGHGQPATAFTAGILHNVGRIAMIQVLPPETLALAGRELADPSTMPLEVERRILGLDHASASGIVSESWGLPVELRRATRNHHDPGLIAGDDDLTALLHVADEMVMSMGYGDPATDRQHAPAPEALRKLNLGETDLGQLREVIAAELKRSARLLNPEQNSD